MKKIIALLMAALLVFAFAGCTDTKDPVEDPSETASQADSAEEAATQKLDLDVEPVTGLDNLAEDSDLAKIISKGTLVVGITDYAPMDYKDPGSDEWTGFDAEFAEAFAEAIGVEVEFIEVDWDNKFFELESNKIDCIWNGMTITPERQENMSISIPYMANKQVIITKAENAEKYAASLEGAKIVAESGSAGEELATTNDFFKNGEFTAVGSQATALSDVKAGVADVAVVDYVLSIGSIGEGTDYSDFVIIEKEEFGSEEYGIAFRKGSDMTEKVNAAIKELAADGTLTKIAEKYKLQDVLLVK